jgi:hypothetical protein
MDYALRVDFCKWYTPVEIDFSSGVLLRAADGEEGSFVAALLRMTANGWSGVRRLCRRAA